MEISSNFVQLPFPGQKVAGNQAADARTDYDDMLHFSNPLGGTGGRFEATEKHLIKNSKNTIECLSKHT